MLLAYQCLADPLGADRIDNIFNNVNRVALDAKESRLDWLSLAVVYNMAIYLEFLLVMIAFPSCHSLWPHTDLMCPQNLG